jgi:hypothetical protein
VSAADVNHLIAGYETDCGIVALSVYLGVSYPDVVRAAALIDRRAGLHGLWRTTAMQVAAALGMPLARHRRFDPDDAYGVIVTGDVRDADHAGVLRNGLVLDRLAVWDLTDWLKYHKATLAKCSLLVVKE